jgi:hypothetical protein
VDNGRAVDFRGVATMGSAEPQDTPLKNLDLVPWDDLRDSTGSAAGVPHLLSAIAQEDEVTALSALAELRRRVCQFGFVVEQATAATVPFLWELARLPGVTCRRQVIELLTSIADARQWEDTAAAYPRLLRHRDNPVGWERRARQAVRDCGGQLRNLLTDEDTEVVRATAELASRIAV